MGQIMHTTHYSSFPLRKTLLALAIGAASQTAMAADAAAAKQPGEETLIVEANETSDFKSGGDLVVPAFLDGQIAHGGRLGMLGEQKAMDVPFNVIGYTSKLIQDQQAKTIADVVSNDAGVQAVQGYGNFAETYRIRGFKLDGDDMTMGGLAGVVPRQVMDTQMLERVEIFKGANSLLNGAASSGVGGMINLEPKRAEDLPTARVGVDYTSDSQVGGTLDLGAVSATTTSSAPGSTWCTARVKALSIMINAVPRWLRWGLITAATVSAPRSISAIRRKRSTAVRWASISAAWISFRRCRTTAKTTARSGAIAISKANSAWRRQNMT
jgi:outer membrane receptor protein involved in Fe transport